MTNIKINGQSIQAEAGKTVLQVAQEHDVHIPTLCYHKDLSPTGNCRMCVVEVKGGRFLQAACVTPIWEGMEIETDSEKVVKDRKMTLELMLANHPPDCMICDVAGECELQDLAYEYQARVPAWGEKTRYAVDSDPNPFIRVDMNKCILCRRCVLACEEIQGRQVWGVAKRGFDEVIVAGAGTTMLEARCESCGQCVAYCPTGALSNKLNYGMARAHQVTKVTTTCAYCGVGCQFDLLVKNNKVIGVSSNPNAPVNGMALCVKGRYAYDYIHHPDRLTKPKVRRYLLEGKNKAEILENRRLENSKEPSHLVSNPLVSSPWDWVEAEWETALDIAAKKISDIQKNHGADKIGVLTSAKCLN
ncbi:MAG: (2Fe-2S)-binding protein, partial [Chloroflexi bacterium]|nr:(2Fe-2S)-binding protein [Chloroflexota bacterium]